MKQILIIGTNKTALKCIKVISSITNMNIVAIIQVDDATDAISYAHTAHIKVEQDLNAWIHTDIDYIFETTGYEEITTKISEIVHPNTTIVSEPLLQMIAPFTNYFSHHVN